MHQPDKYRELFQNAATNKLIGVEQVQGFPEEELKFIKTPYSSDGYQVALEITQSVEENK